MQAQLIDNLRYRVAHLGSSQFKGVARGRQFRTDEHSVASEFRRYAQRFERFILSGPQLLSLLQYRAEVAGDIQGSLIRGKSGQRLAGYRHRCSGVIQGEQIVPDGSPGCSSVHTLKTK